MTSLFGSAEIERHQVKLVSLTHLNMNGNLLTEIPEVTKFLPNLKQLHLHMNKITSVRLLCRPAFSGLETLDLGGNKMTEVPVALIHYCKSICQLTLINNDIQRLPNLIGMHKCIK